MCFSCCNCIFETCQFEISCSYETSCKFEQGNGAIAAHWQAKVGVNPPFAGCERPFSLRAMIANHEPQANKKFFDPAIFQKCWRGSGRVALIAARRQRNPCAMLLAHGGGGEKSDSFSRRGEQDRPALWHRNRKQVSCNCSGGTVATKYYFIENPAPRENDFQHPAKGGSTPAFACQRAAIAPLPCSNLQLIS